MRRRCMTGAVGALGVFATGLALVVEVAGGAERPVQFEAWGSCAGEQAPLPPGWKETRPDVDDLRGPLQSGGIPSAARARGALVFSRCATDPIYPGSFPREDDLTGEVRAFATPGEYEPMTFAVRALRELKEVTVHVGDLTGPGGASLPSEYFDVRVVRCLRFAVGRHRKEYVLHPMLLEKPPSVDVPADRTQAFWVTAYVPPDASPGEYRGKLTIRSAGAELAGMSVRLKVLPIRLKRPPQTYMMSSGRVSLGDEAAYMKVTRDQWEHGMNAFEFAGTGEVGRRDPANRTRRLPAEHLAPMKEGAELRADMWLKTEFAREPRPVSIGGGGGPPFHWVTNNWDNRKGWFVQWPLNEHLDGNVITLIEMVEEVRRRKGLPQVQYYLYDEAGGHPETFPYAVHYYTLLKRRFPRLKTFTTIGGGLPLGVAEIDQLCPVVDVLSTNRISEKIIRDIRERGREFQIYNGGSHSDGHALEHPAKDRLFFGFYTWKTTATGVFQWVYYFSRIGSSPFRGNEGYCYPSSDGPVPTVQWEAIREGVDDMRYVVTLWELILKGRKARRSQVRREAEAAAAALAGIEKMIPIPREKIEGHALAAKTLSPRVYDKWRWRLAGHIMRLQKLMGPGAGGEAASSGQRRRPDQARFPPRGFEYTPAGSGPKLGRSELIPDGGFEEGTGRWSVQAWKGKGSGGRVRSAAHAGRASVRLTNTGKAGGGPPEVLVCVWYKPEIPLVAGRTYRLSAWIKTRGVTSGVKLRASLAGAGDSPGLAGTAEWREVGYEFTPTTDGPPRYLAVWLQGPGTVWVDDLSLREVMVDRAPLEVVLDSDEYYLSERVARGRVRITVPEARLEGASLSVRVLSPRGREEHSATEAVRGRSFAVRIPLPGSQGPHELRAALVSSSGGTLGESRTSFICTGGPFTR